MFNYKLWLFELSVIMVAAIAMITTNGATVHFDTLYGGAIQSLRGDSLNTFVEFITYLGNWQSIVIICILLVAFKSTRMKFGIPVTAVAIISSVVNRLLKTFITRPRPDAGNMLINESGFSFPSGHTATAIAVGVLIAYILIKNSENKNRDIPIAIALVTLAISISLSRIYIGVHYASDVFAGIFVGLASFSLVAMFFYPYKNEKAKWRKKFYEKLDGLEEIQAEVIEKDK